MRPQSLNNILYTFLNWHPARIQTYIELIFGVIKARTVIIKELAKQVSSGGKIRVRIAKVERLLSEQEIDYTIIGQIIRMLIPKLKKVRIAIDRTNCDVATVNRTDYVI